MSISESEPLEYFLYAIKSPITADRYKRRLRNFFDFLDVEGDLDSQSKSFMGKANKNGKRWVFANVMKFLSYHKERAERGEIADATVRNYYKPLKLFLEMNDFELSWKKIARGLPRGRRHAADRAPTLIEIQKLAEYPDRRIKAIIFTMCSSAIRLGAWDYLRWRDITPIKKDTKIIAAKLIAYAGDEDQYTTFISSEAYFELKKLMDFRKDSGEKVSEDSWLMRDLWDIEKNARGLVTIPKKLSSAGVKRLIERALKAQGIRKTLPQGQRRHEFQTNHGFRKFFKTHAEQSMKPINVEMLMGHSTGVSDSYYRPNDNELLQDYLNAIPELTILKENRMSNQKEKIRTHDSDIVELKEEIEKIKLRNQVYDAYRQGIIEWAEKNPDKIQPIQIAKADLTKTKGLDEFVDHLLTKHDGNMKGVKEMFAKSRITLDHENS